MILNKDIYWNILDFTFKKLTFLEECMNPSEIINIDTSDEKSAWLGDLIKQYESESCPKEAILSALHILTQREMLKIRYVAAKKDFLLIDLTAKGYEEYLRMQKIIP